MKVYGFYLNEVVEMEAEDKGAYVRLPKRHPAFRFNLLVSKFNTFLSKEDLLMQVYDHTECEIKAHQDTAMALKQELKRIKRRYGKCC